MKVSTWELYAVDDGQRVGNTVDNSEKQEIVIRSFRASSVKEEI